MGRTLGKLGEVSALDVIVRLEEDLTEARFADRVVLKVELVESVEGVLVRVHVERVHGEVVRGEVQRLEHLLKRQLRTIPEDHHILRARSLFSQGGTEEGSEGRTCGQRFIFDLMNRKRCFWFMLLE